MKKFIYTLYILTFFTSCGKPCETLEVWKIKDYVITKKECPDMVKTSYYSYSIYRNNEKSKMTAYRKDSCTFTWQAEKDRFLILDVCKNRVSEIKPKKNLFDLKKIDSGLIYSNTQKQIKKLTLEQIQKFTSDWKNSKIRGYSEEPFDSAFSFYPAYQYKLTLYSGLNKTEFYGYNFLILDSTNWKYEISNSENLDYWNHYWEE
ncbi:hypothetical protein ACOSP6_01600 [Tenacibaculum sp. MEBiC06402]|uniref:hypothetical protein n=1 Tax=unclassified Tenacibaculum TaxID=2635139 RepID=UPI003B9CD896